MLRYLKFSLLLSVSLLSACATSVVNPSAPELTEGESRVAKWQLPEESLKATREIEEEILQADADISAPSSKRGRIPIEINENVRKWIQFFTIRDRARFHRFLKRGSVYKTLVKDILRKHEVPTDLYYLAMIESGYMTHARSHAQAVGAWQFIRGTGKRYGLSQNSYVDERRDIVRSTEAAAKYLRNLHTAFQSWYLAMAGYNAGEGRILEAIMRGGSRDFWDLVEKKALPPETRNYVPKFLAAVIIGKHPDKYGFSDIEAEPFPRMEAAQVPGGVSLARLANKSHVSVETLKTLNPHLIRSITPANVKTYTLWVPEGSAGSVSQAAAHLPRATRVIASEHFSRNGIHVVRRGENLGLIARRHGMSVSQLKKLNGLRSNVIYAGKRLKVRGGEARSVTQVYHRVRAGDRLIPIARRYGVPVSQIKKLNRLRSNRIYIGQRLLVRKDI